MSMPREISSGSILKVSFNVQKIVTSLDISRVDFRSEVDVDVAKYTFRRDLIVEPIGQDDVSKGSLT